MQLGRFLLKRLLYAVPLFFFAVTLIFVLIRLAPGDPVDYMLGEMGGDPVFVERMRRDLGLDQPIYVQLVKYVRQVATGNLGFSFASNAPVLALILDRFPATFLLMITQYVLAAAMGIGLGVLSVRRPNSCFDNTVTVLSLASFAIPAFWLGQMMILVFGYHLNWFPIQGMYNLRAGYTGFAAVLDVAYHMVLPVITLSLLSLALIIRLTRGSMLQVIGQEYVKVARAKGLSERVVLVKHALPNALLPVVTVIGMEFPNLLAGAVLTETVFAWPGLGRLTFDAIAARDYPLLMGMFIFISALVIVGNLITDIVYAILDPRIRYQ
jgi:ABC-type dipeptide/oligopeptide/nickel transport system permease component